MASASSQAGSNKAAAARAASEAFEGALDSVVALGWAHTEHFCLDNFAKVKGIRGAFMSWYSGPEIGTFGALFARTLRQDQGNKGCSFVN
jgi:hypothetical protein